MIDAAPRNRKPRKYVVQVKNPTGEWGAITQPVTRSQAFSLRDHLNSRGQIIEDIEGITEIWYEYRVFNTYTGREST